jgi:uncharacterized protein DUF4382
MRSRSIIITLFAVLVAGCDTGPQTGEIQLALVGADQIALFGLPSQPTAPDHNGIVSAIVTIKEIDARIGGAWIPVTTTPQQIDLLALDNKTLNTLGIVKLPVGHIDELRLQLDDVGDYVVLSDGSKKPLEVPENGGIVKVKGELDLDACTAGIVILDFDPKIKVEDEGGSKEYELRSVARVKTEELKNACGGGNGPDMAKGGGADLAGSCNGVICPGGEVCQGGVCVADPCAGVVCPGGQMCQGGICVATSDGGTSDGGADGGCHHH